jgi:hypothetical protein
MAEDRTAAISAVKGSRWAIFARAAETSSGGLAVRDFAHTIGRLISALDDRNVGAAMYLLEALPGSSGPGHGPVQDRTVRRKCVGCGE